MRAKWTLFAAILVISKLADLFICGRQTPASPAHHHEMAA
jgi:hypothetical protein